MEPDSLNFNTRARLEELAARSGVFMNQSPRPSGTRTIPPFTENDQATAAALVMQTRKDAFSSKSHIFRRNPSQRSFKRDEIYTAMESIIRSDGSPGVLRCLLELSRESKAKRHILFNKDDSKTPDMNSLLWLATEKGNSGMVHILAQDAGPEELDQSLRLAVASDNMDCIAVLLQSGANPNTACSDSFVRAVDDGNRAFVDLFLGRSKIAIERSTLDRALAGAVRGGVIQTVIALLQRGANGDNVEVLGISIQNGRIDITAALVMATRRPCPASLDQVFYAARRAPSKGLQLTLMEILLCGGANGTNVGKTLVEAVKDNDEGLVSLILAYNGTVTYNSSEPILTAIADGNLGLLRILFQGHMGADDASYVLESLPTYRGRLIPSDFLYIVQALVQKGAHGQALDKCLLHAAKGGESSLVHFLIGSGASVDYLGAEALLFSLKSGSIPILNALLEGKPSQFSLGRCLTLIDQAPSNLRLHMMTGLLAAGAKGGAVDNVLVRAIAGDFTTERETVIETLVKNGADVNTGSGVCFVKAATAGDIVALNILLKGRPSPESLSAAIPSAFQIRNKEMQFAMLGSLLTSGARGPIVAQKFLDLVNELHADIGLVTLFLEKGDIDVNSNDGEPIKVACTHNNNDLLKLLLGYRPSTQTLNAAFSCAVASQAPDSQYKLCRQLLAAGVQGEVVDSGLIDVQRSSSSHPRLLELLLEHGANVSHDNGSVIRRAIKSDDVQQLALLVSKKPTPQVMAVALENLVTADTAKRNQMADIILSRSEGRLFETMNAVLPAAVGLQRSDIPFLELLLQHGASVDYHQGLAIRKAIEIRNPNIMQLLLDQPVTMQTLEEVFNTTWSLLAKPDRMEYTRRVLVAGYRGLPINDALLEAIQEKPYDLPIITLLLEHGASVHYQKHKALVHAATSMDIRLLEIFLQSVSERIGVASAFGELVASSLDWLSDAGYAVIDLLLRNGASGDLVAIALIMVVENSEGTPRALDFVELFLSYGASVDYQNARALLSALKANRQTVVKKIVTCRPSSENISVAFSALMECDFTEDTTVELIKIFKNGSAEMPDLNALSDATQEEPLTFVCLRKYPRGTKVLEQILEAGVHIDKAVPYVIESEHGLEHVTLLLWTLLQPQQKISSYVIDCLLQHGAHASFQSNLTMTTPLLVASQERSPETVLKLIQHGADVSVNDANGKTPLFYASQRGQTAAMGHLIGKGAIVNDGSLHEAARALHPEAVHLLVSQGHEADFPSTLLHEGRSALAELCLKATCVGIPRAKIRQIIDALVAGKADLMMESQGKPALLHALDNLTACVVITTELLSAGMWKHINSERNRYVEHDTVYSPTTYISKCVSRSPREHAPELLRILKANGCKDVYYKQSGPQPPDMVGAPREAILEEQRRQARLQRIEEEEEEHQLSLQRNRDVAYQQHDLLTQTHQLRIQHGRETADERDTALEKSVRLQLQLEADGASQRRRFAEEQRAAELTQMREMDMIRIAAERQRNHLQLEHDQVLTQNQKSLLDVKLAAELRRLQETEGMSKRQYDRELAIMGRQEQLMSERKKLLGSGSETSEKGETKLLEYDGSNLD